MSGDECVALKEGYIVWVAPQWTGLSERRRRTAGRVELWGQTRKV